MYTNRFGTAASKEVTGAMTAWYRMIEFTLMPDVLRRQV
jgi:hypothetical protein